MLQKMVFVILYNRTRHFCYSNYEKGDYILEYKGQLTSSDPDSTCDTYVYEFIHNGKRTW